MDQKPKPRDKKNGKGKSLVLVLGAGFVVTMFVVALSFWNSANEVLEKTSSTAKDLSELLCTANSFLLGDGNCDDVTNTEQCLFDQGDCCLSTEASKKSCSNCTCMVKVDQGFILSGLHEHNVSMLEIGHFEGPKSTRVHLWTNVQSVEVCAVLSLSLLNKEQDEDWLFNSWTFDPEKSTCTTYNLKKESLCKTLLGQSVAGVDEVLEETIFVLGTKTSIRNDCTERILIFGSNYHDEQQPSEMINLENPPAGDCSPIPILDNVDMSSNDATGGIFPDGTVAICGGPRIVALIENPDDSGDKCIIVDEVHGITEQRLIEGRQGAASVVLDGNTLYIAGGYYINYIPFDGFLEKQRLKSTEYLELRASSTLGPNLPTPMDSHCMVKFDQSEVVAIGRSEMFFYDHGTMSWSLSNEEVPFVGGYFDYMFLNALYFIDFQCSSLYDSWLIVSGVAVSTTDTGVADGRKDVLKETWMWQKTESKWQQGPTLPHRRCCGALVASSDKSSVFMIGGKHHPDSEDEGLTSILKLRCTVKNPESCHWTIMAKTLATPRHYFFAFGVSAEMSDCDLKIAENQPICYLDSTLVVGDGFCDDMSNNEQCLFDGSDCCLDSIQDSFCTECQCHETNKKHPTFSIEGHPSMEKEDLKSCPQYLSIIGDGICDDLTNNRECLYDGNDCCNEDSLKVLDFCLFCECLTGESATDLIRRCDEENRGLYNDGYCHPKNMNVECGFDGNDCCLEVNSNVWQQDWYCHQNFTKDNLPDLCQSPDLIDDGVCHEAARNYDCYYDGNDCIPHSGGQYERRLQYFNTGACSKEMILKVGDSICDDDTNNYQCNFDGMDCCNPDDISIKVTHLETCFYCACHLTVTAPMADLNAWMEYHLNIWF